MTYSIAISRKLLTEAHDLLRKHFPQMKNVHMIGWTFKYDDHWEFHINGFIWHGKANNAYDARYKGWISWLKHKGIEI